MRVYFPPFLFSDTINLLNMSKNRIVFILFILIWIVGLGSRLQAAGCGDTN